MRIAKVLTLVLILALVTGCSCRTGRMSGNVPYGSEEGPLLDVRFQFDSAELDAEAQSRLDDNVKWLDKNDDATAKIEGHCDERGTNEYNMALGQRRAQSVADYYKAKGIKASRLSTVSYGEEVALDPAHNEEAWKKNRRVHHDVTE